MGGCMGGLKQVVILVRGLLAAVIHNRDTPTHKGGRAFPLYGDENIRRIRAIDALRNRDMRFLIVAMASFFLTTAPSFARQSDSSTKAGVAGAGQSTDQDDIWKALLTVLDAPKGLTSYDDIKRVFLSQFDCKDEFSGSSLGTKGNDKGIEVGGGKSHCRDDVIIEYFGRIHYRDGDTPFHYQFNLFLFPTSLRCIPADMALRALGDRHWAAQSMVPPLPAFTPSKPPVVSFVEPFPNTEELRSAVGNRFLSIHWASKENPNSLMGIDPSESCLQGVQITNEQEDKS
jgi:hypothetical protein